MSKKVISSLNFLPENLIMVDCEMSGVVPKKDELLQIAMIRLEKNGFEYVESGEPLVLYLHTDSIPSRKFHKDFLSEIFNKCNVSTLKPAQARKLVDEWLGDLRGHVIPVGDCVIADLRFLYENKIIEDSSFDENDVQVQGTFHHEIYDMNILKDIAYSIWSEKKKPEGLDENIHDALIDCRNQLMELNHTLGAIFHKDSPQEPSNIKASVENLPENIAPSTEVENLPNHIDILDLELDYLNLFIAVSSFEELQGLINKIMLEKGIVEDYRDDLAGLINKSRQEMNLEVF